jgi:hypothetical protein
MLTLNLIIHAAVPKSGAKFSLADIKAKMVKKEKSEETPAPKPVHVPATRSKISAKKRKAADPIIQLESFEGLSAMEVKDKMHSLYSMMHLVSTSVCFLVLESR